MLRLLVLSCLLYLAMVHGKKEDNTDILHFILREQASMIKHCMSNVCTRNMYNPNRPVKPWGKMVAFSAYPSSPMTLSANKKVVFGKTYTNIGNAYDITTGIFTAPVPGVYAFHWTIMVHPGKYSQIHIQINGTSKVGLYGYAKSYQHYYTPSQSYVTHLNIGDKVNLYCTSSDGYAHSLSSTFTGYRVM